MVKVFEISNQKHILTQGLFFLVLILQVLATYNSSSLYQKTEVKIDNQFSSVASMSSQTSFNTHTMTPIINYKLLPDQDISILFIVANDKSLDSILDVPFYNFMTTNMSFSVTYHKANDSYNYTSYDAIVISKSVDIAPVDSLINEAIPILTMEPSHWQEFKLGDGNALTPNYYEWRIASEPHYITQDEIPYPPATSIYTGKDTFYYLTGFDELNYPIGCEVKDLAYHNSPSAEGKYASLTALEKNALNFNLTQSKERRVFWGASSTNLYLPTTWNLWNNTLHWILYDDIQGNATINVLVENKQQKKIENAEVRIIDSINSSTYWVENTTQSGIATFTNIPWGNYDIRASYSTEVNTSLTNLQITPEHTYLQKDTFNYSVTLDIVIDDNAPVIEDIVFNNITYAFYANVSDDSELEYVYLNLTAQDLKTGAIKITLQNFTMVYLSDDTYYNNTALDSLSIDHVNVIYNILAEDIFGNSYASPIQIFKFDKVPPEISDVIFLNLTSTFYANISDQSPLKFVKLNLTAHNLETGAVEITLQNFTMIYLSHNTYYNETALDLLSTPNVNITYNILAEDVYGNFYASPVITFDLGELTAPTIHCYNVTDYGNGTIIFYANITDENGIQPPVLLNINGSYYEMYKNASNWWIFRKEFAYGFVLNYTIYSVLNTIGNLNGTIKYPSIIGYKFHQMKDTSSPLIKPYASYLNFSTILDHEEGYVEFIFKVEDNTYGSGVNTSSIEIFLFINGDLYSCKTQYLGSNLYFAHYEFEWNDTIYYWIRAFDNVNNSINSSTQGPFTINDNVYPLATSWANDLGNGMVEFYASISDWPKNDTTASLYYTFNYPVDWIINPMDKVTPTIFSITIPFLYQVQSIWYYVNASDLENNCVHTNEKSFSLKDEVPPVIHLTYSNSTTTDGEITLLAFATDPFGASYYVNNTIYVNITYQSSTITYEMSYDYFYYYKLTLCYPFQSIITVTVYVEDYHGNLGSLTKILFVDDFSPPKILQYGLIDHQNGTITIWAEVYESSNGSGLIELDENSSVHLEYIQSNQKISVIMKSNGTTNFYSYYIHGFDPGNSFSYIIHTFDKQNNFYETIPEIYTVDDKIAPIYNHSYFNQARINHTHFKIEFWVEAYDPFGTIRIVILLIEYTNSFSSDVVEVNMSGNEPLFEYKDLIMLSNSNFNYTILILDEFNNENITFKANNSLSDYLPTEILDYGCYNISLEPGYILFWIYVNNTFHDENATLALYRQNSNDLIMNETLMNFNGTIGFYSFIYQLKYRDNITYVMKIKDLGTFYGYYEIEDKKGSFMMKDVWPPIVEAFGLNKNNNNVTFFALINEWGSDYSELEVNLYIQNKSLVFREGIGSQQNSLWEFRMKWNGSYFIHSMVFNSSISIDFYIVARDKNGNVDSSQDWMKTESIFVPNTAPLPSDNSFDVIVAVILTSSLILSIFLSFVLVNRYRRRIELKEKLGLDFKRRIEFFSEIYSLVVTTGVGIPILDVNNVLYHKSSDTNGSLSGLSVGIDSFLESFQTDFISQIQGDSSLLQEEKESGIRLSLIEKERIQILIAASSSYRMFLFMKEKPMKFIRDLLRKAIMEIEKEIPLADQGIVDENIIAPQVLSILRKSIPLTLLHPFIIDIKRLIDLDLVLKSEKEIGIVKNQLNALKQLAMVKTLNLPVKEIKQKISSFNTTLANSQITRTSKIIYTEAVNIMDNLLEIPYKDIFEALWIGCSPKVKIIVPERDFFQFHSIY